jgi:outer membrane lipoprotein SlyB
MAPKTDPAKKVDLPPTGRRNADPITSAPGSHPIETGIGAAAVGAAGGMAAGAFAGPVGAALGAAVGAVAGGYAGKGVGEMIDPTTDDHWLRENFESRPYVQEGDTFERYQPAYRYGVPTSP